MKRQQNDNLKSLYEQFQTYNKVKIWLNVNSWGNLKIK